MPTGYTAELCKKDQPFSVFALNCARAFGACVDQREDPMSDLPEVPVRDSYHEKEYDQAVIKLAAFEAMTIAERTAYGKKKRAADIANSKQCIKEKTVVRDRLLKMIEEAHAWVPPTPDHTNLKTFMLEQLTTTLDHDADVSYYIQELARAKASDPMSYYDAAVVNTKWSINYHKENTVKEVNRDNDRRAWVTALYNSFSNDADLAWILLNKK